ncbi:MAG: HlyD family secretion protein [Patescibacteria group bacterium]|jgi:HlyD family secretion protein
MDEIIKKKNKIPQRIAIGVLALALLSWLAFSFYESAGTSKLNVQSSRILTHTVEEGIFQEFIPVTGVVQPIKTVIVAAVEGGRIEEKFLEDGANVSAGTPILRLSNSDLQLSYLNQEGTIIAQINQIRNMNLLQEQQSLNLKESALDVEYRLDLIKRKMKRDRVLFVNNAIARVEFEDLESEHNNLVKRNRLLQRSIEKDSLSTIIQLEQMDNALDLMKRNLDISKRNLENLTVKSPIKGQLSGLSFEVGELIPEGAQIGQIDDLSNFKIRVRIDEFYISRIFPEQEGSFTFASEDFQLRITKIYPQVINGSFEVDMHFVNKVPTGIRRGQTVTVKLQLSAEQQAILVKRGGFYQSTGGNWVYILSPDGTKATKREIRIGRQNPNYYEVLDGLEPGEVVITSSYENYGEKDELVLSD